MTNLSAVGRFLIGESGAKRIFQLPLRTRPPPDRPCIASPVPRLLHFVWLQSGLPEVYAANIRRQAELNPGWQVVLWLEHPLPAASEKALAPFDVLVRNVTEYIADRFRNRAAIERWRNPGGKADLVRLEVVHLEGGIYQDTDAIALRPFDSAGTLFRWPWVTFSTRRWKNSCNCAFGFERGSAFLRFALDQAREYCSLPPEEATGYGCTKGAPGPMMLTRSLREWADPEIILLHGNLMVGHPPLNASITTHTMDASWQKFPGRL